MKKFTILTGIMTLAAVFGITCPVIANHVSPDSAFCDNKPDHPGCDSGPRETLSILFAPFVLNSGAEVANSQGVITGEGEWNVGTSALTGSVDFDICLRDVSGTTFLATVTSAADGTLLTSGNNIIGTLQQPSLQLINTGGTGGDCLGTLEEETGISIR